MDEAANRSGRSAGRLRILAAEDAPTTRRILEAGLRRHLPEAEILLAANGEEGLEVSEGLHLELAILDVMMPKRDGTSLARELLRRGQIQQERIVFLTALERCDERVRALRREGFAHILHKPFSLKLLQKELTRVLGPVAQGAAEPCEPQAAPACATALLPQMCEVEREIGLDREEYEEVLGEFFATWPERLERFGRLRAAGDWERLACEAHSLKGTTGSLLIAPARKGAEALEQAARARDGSAAERVTQDLARLLGEVRAALSPGAAAPSDA